MPPATDIPDGAALREGVRMALQLYVGEGSLDMAVGETGVIRASVEIFLERGRAKHSKGSCYFERRMELK